MAGIGSTNAMKKGSGNNPFLASTEADMRTFLNSAYVGCIVKYTGDAIQREITDANRTTAEHAQNIVFKKYAFPELALKNGASINIFEKDSEGTVTESYIVNGAIKDGIFYYDKSSLTTPYVDVLAWVDAKENNANVKAVLYDSVYRWHHDTINDQQMITLWSYSDDVTFTITGDLSGFELLMYIEPYKVGELYKVVYSGGEYYFEEYCYISEYKTTGNSDYIAPGKTMYDFTGELQVGNGSKVNPYIASTTDEMAAYLTSSYKGAFVKYTGETTENYVKNAVYQVSEDGDTTMYMVLPSLDNEGSASDLAAGKQLINSQGEVIDGTAPTQGDIIALYANRQLTEFITDAEIERIGFSTLNGLYSTTSGVLCFNYQSMLERVECPNLKNLYIYAFVGCDKLSYISIPYETDIHQYSNYGGTNYFPSNLYMSHNAVYGYDTNGDGKIEYITHIDTTNSSAALGAKVLMPYAFTSQAYMTSINLPDVLTIAESAYSYNYSKSNNSSIKLISLPECRKIGSYAFRGLVSLSKVYCPNVEHLRYSAFAGCTMLSDITLDNLKTVGGYVFEGTDIHQNYFSKVISWHTGYGMASNISELYLPIATDVTESNRYLTSISIPNAVTVSLSLNNVSSLDLPNAQYCTYLLSGSNIETISIPKLQYCRILYLPNCTNINAPCLTNVSTGTAYSGLTIYANNATSINISNFVDAVTICSCSKLEYLNAENARQVELSNNFILNSKLVPAISKMNNFIIYASTSEDLSITIDNENLTYMYLSLSNISNYTTYCTVRINNASSDLSGFYVYGNAITKLTLGYSGFRSLRWNSVTVKARLSELYLTSNCTYLNSSMFSNIASLQTISVDSGVTIGSYCFSGCSNLSEVFVRNRTYLYNYAFSGCSKLSAFIIASPTEVNDIYSSAFYNTAISNSTYLGYYGSIYVPSSYVQSYRRASGWSEYYYRITSITNLPQELKDKYGLNGVE